MSLIDSYLTLHSKSKNIALKSTLNSFFDKIVVINLKRSVSRLAKVTKQLRALGIQYEIFNAIDGKSESIKKDYEQYLQNRREDQKIIKRPAIDGKLESIKKDYEQYMQNRKEVEDQKIIKRPGEYAYLLTWIKLLKKAIEEKWSRLLVFEDDVLLSDDFSGRAAHWLKYDVPNNAVVWLFGATQLPHLRNIINHDRHYFRPDRTDGSFAVGLDNKVFPFLLREVEKLDKPFDSGPLRFIYQKYKDRCYAVFPYLVIAEVNDSTIRAPKDLIKVADKLEWNLNDFSVHKKNQKNLSIALTLFLRPEEMVSAIKDLLCESMIDWNIFFIFHEKEEEELEPLLAKSEKNLSYFIYPKVVKSLKLAQQIAEQHWLSKDNMKSFDYVIFYDVALMLDNNVLHSIATFF